LLAGVLFALCVAAERTGFIAPQSLFPIMKQQIPVSEAVFDVVSAIAQWSVMWYLVSYLSMAIRLRDAALAEVNRKLLVSQEERLRHMLVTAHQLKTPFSAIYANAQLLTEGYCGKLPDSALPIVERISLRCLRLSREIKEMLELASLSSEPPRSEKIDRLALPDIIRWCINQLEPICQERKIRLRSELREASADIVEDHLKLLLMNLLSNAISYSHDGGEIIARCSCRSDGRAEVDIIDEGIGIPAGKLPRIFEEYYRTNEAVLHNRESSGLGLSIVRKVAQRYAIEIRVNSAVGTGTAFHLTFPRLSDIANTNLHGPSLDLEPNYRI
jgi:signal transduction histidine kinase